MDYYFAQVEELRDPSLKNKPFAIGSDHPRGVLSTCNYKAREYGVRSALSSVKAKLLCPNLIFVRGRMDVYKKISQEIFKLLYEYTDLVEIVSIDEAYLDVTNCDLFYNSATLIALDIRKRIFELTGLTCSCGVSYNKFFAKFASEYNKPNGVFIIPPNVLESFVHSINVREVSGVGRVSQKKLLDEGVVVLGDVLRFNSDDFISKFGKTGELLISRAKGIDKREIVTYRERKSLSCEHTFETDITEFEVLERYFEKVFERFLERLSRYDKKYSIGTTFVKIKYHNFEVATIERAGDSIDKAVFFKLFKERFSENKQAVRLIGLGVKFANKELSQLKLPFLN